MVYLGLDDPLFHWASIRDEVGRDVAIIEQSCPGD